MIFGHVAHPLFSLVYTYTWYKTYEDIDSNSSFYLYQQWQRFNIKFRT